MWWVRCEEAEDTWRLGQALAEVARPGTVVSLDGDLGAGKTCFSQGVGAGLEVAEPVVSPTFILVAEYEGRLPLLHADAYRLEPGEVEQIGLEESLEGWPGVALVEWATRVEEALPGDRLRVLLLLDEPGRRVEITATGKRSAAVLDAWRARWEASS